MKDLIKSDRGGFGALRCAVFAPFGCSAVLAPGRPFTEAMELSSAFVALDLYLAGASVLFESLSLRH